jgi:hypothetical protein
MPENGAKTVENWQPDHEGCQVICRVSRTEGCSVFVDVTVSWTRPPVKGLDRIKTFKVSARVTTNDERTRASLDRYCEEQIDRIVHADSLKLLHRGPRSMRADADRFEAEKLRGKLCPA